MGRKADGQGAAAKIAIVTPKPASKKTKAKKAFEPRKSAGLLRTEAARERRLKNEALWELNKVARGDDNPRLTHNAAIKAKAEMGHNDAKQREAENFARLLREWRQAITYVHQFARAAANASDVIDAEARADAIEREWLRIATLPTSHPEYFKWPTTDARAGEGGIDGSDWKHLGMLLYLGYSVGKYAALTQERRQTLLLRAFAMNLPPLNGPAYLREWGAPGSPSRLRKMAVSIAALTKNAKRRRQMNMQTAISHWEADLRFLRKRLYVGKFRFGWTWPVT